ncbi:MAG: hypothetical protein DHS20C01_34210 [marine bacterium B5-7]|nr:MAG: hypothetical protein DHS20C01_34210 [marine bacterium B5-7]
MALDPKKDFLEDLYEPTKIYLFGKRFTSLKLQTNKLKKTEHRLDVGDAAGGGDNVKDIPMPPPKLERMFRRNKKGKEFRVPQNPDPNDPDDDDDDTRIGETNELKPRLSRIYSFSYEGHYYKLPCPRIFMVWGKGEPADDNTSRKQKGWSQFKTVDTGLESKGFRFGSDIRVWKIDRLDMSMAIDLEFGKFQNILLEPMFMMLEQNASGAANGSSRMAMASRMAMNSRMAMASRMAMVGPHQD